MKLSTGMYAPIHSYKHNHALHRIWKKTVILEHRSEVLVTANNKTQVIEHDGRSWHTKEPAICFFYQDFWFNVIAMLKKDGIYFYCNLSSPYLYDGEAIKYIDYDLDVKVFPDGKYQVLDEREYKFHAQEMNYPESIKKIIDTQLQILIQKIEKKSHPFNEDYVLSYFQQYQSLS